MSTFLIKLGTMSVQASVAIGVVLVLRWIFAKITISKKYVMFLWMIPFLLLICPWKLSVPVGLWSVAPSDYDEQYTQDTMERWAESLLVTEQIQVQMQVESGAETDNVTVFESDDIENEDVHYQIVEADMAVLQHSLNAATCIWLMGLVCLLSHTVISYIALRKKVECCVQKEDGTCYVDDLPVPLVVGFLNPKIYLPSGMAKEHVSYVVEHEKTHIRRKDPIAKLAAYVIVCVHWFNPLVWLAYHLLEKDMEMACDEETIGRIGMEEKKQYATALLQLSTGAHRNFAMPLAFGEGDTKGRIKNVMHYKKTVKVVAILAVALGVFLLVVFMTKNADESENIVDAGNVLTFELLQEIEKNNVWESTDFFAFENYEQEEGTAISFRELEYNGELYSLLVLYDETMNEIRKAHFTRLSNGDGTTLFSANGGFSESLEDFFAGKINIGYWLDVDLPEGYALKDAATSGWQEGSALIVPQAYELYSDKLYASEQWYHAGALGRLSSGGSCFAFENGKLKGLNEALWNSSKEEYLGVFDLDWQALMMYYEHPLYMQEALIELENRGELDMSKVETTSDYWYFYFAEEGEREAYYLSLSAKLFSKEEAIAIARTVDIKKNNVQSQMQQEELTFDVLRKAVATETLHFFDFHSFANGEEWYFEDEKALNYYINFSFDYVGEVYKVQASHWIENDELESVYIARESDGEMRWLYRDANGINNYSDYLEPLLLGKENVDAWLSVELPDGYFLGNYLAYNGIAGGALIYPQAYEVYDWAVMAPQDWYHAGFIGKIPYAQDYFRFENGKLVDGQMGWWNHTSGEQLGVLDLDWQVLWMQANHDLYTASTAWDLVEAGIDTEQTEMTSDYWYFFFAKEGEETAYYISLSQKLFTEEEALAIAATVDIKE